MQRSLHEVPFQGTKAKVEYHAGLGDLVFLFLNRTVIFQKHILQFKKYLESNRISLQNLYLLMLNFLLMQYPG
jgi:hypothetical protein